MLEENKIVTLITEKCKTHSVNNRRKINVNTTCTNKTKQRQRKGKRIESNGRYKPVLHLGYAFHASSCITRASFGAIVVSQAGALLQKLVQK